MTEQWKPIPGHDGYEASSLGNIKSPSGKILKPSKKGPKRKPYLAVYVGGGRKACKKPVHRLVLSAFLGMPEDGQMGLHKDDNQLNNNISNLYWGNAKQNAKDQINSGKFAFKNLDTTKYSDDVVSAIRSEFTGKRGEQTMLARKYGMSISNVHLIVREKVRAS